MAKPDHELESYKHTNKVQAQEIGELRTRLQAAQLAGQRAEVERDIAKVKHRNLLKHYRALKDLIRHLGSTETDIEFQDHEK